MACTDPEFFEIWRTGRASALQISKNLRLYQAAGKDIGLSKDHIL
jgi:hypothetical protein